MAAAVAKIFSMAAQHLTQHKEPQTPEGGHICENSKLLSVAQLYLQAWRWLQQPGTTCHQHRNSARLFVRLLRLCALRLLTHGLLRTGVFLQRHLPGHGPMGRLGLWPRLGRPSLRQRWWWRKLPRERRNCSWPRISSKSVGKSSRRRSRGSHQCSPHEHDSDEHRCGKSWRNAARRCTCCTARGGKPT